MYDPWKIFSVWGNLFKTQNDIQESTLSKRKELQTRNGVQDINDTPFCVYLYKLHFIIVLEPREKKKENFIQVNCSGW